MTRVVTFSFLLLCVVFVWALQAEAEDWHICNRTPEALNVAIGYLDRSDRWTSEGWWTLNACGGCKMVMERSKTNNRTVYFRAETMNGVQRNFGPTMFCTSNRAYTIRDTRDCERRGYSRAGFMEANMKGGGKYTTDILPPPGPGPRCID